MTPAEGENQQCAVAIAQGWLAPSLCDADVAGAFFSSGATQGLFSILMSV
jgi:hypothetical protein